MYIYTIYLKKSCVYLVIKIVRCLFMTIGLVIVPTALSFFIRPQFDNIFGLVILFHVYSGLLFLSYFLYDCPVCRL